MWQVKFVEWGGVALWLVWPASKKGATFESSQAVRCAALRSVPCVCLCVIAKHKQVYEGRTRNDDDDECVWVHEPVDEAQEHLAANFVERIIVRDFMLVVVRVTLVRVHAAYAAARVHDIRSYQTIPARKE